MVSTVLHTRRRHTKDYQFANWITVTASVHSTTASEFRPFPQLTNSWLPTTDYQYSGYCSCYLEYCLHRTKSTVVVDTRWEHTYCLECCQRDDPQTCSKKEQSNQEPPNSNQRRPPRIPDYVRNYTNSATAPLGIAGVVSHQGNTAQPRYKIQ